MTAINRKYVHPVIFHLCSYVSHANKKHFKTSCIKQSRLMQDVLNSSSCTSILRKDSTESVCFPKNWLPSAWHSCRFVSLVSIWKKRRHVLFTSAHSAKEAFKSFSHGGSNVWISFLQHCPFVEHPIIDAEHPELMWCVQLHNYHQPRWEEQVETRKKKNSNWIYLRRKTICGYLLGWMTPLLPSWRWVH